MTPQTPERDDVWFAARMTNIQFEALWHRLQPVTVQAQLKPIIEKCSPLLGAKRDVGEIAKWLVNGWSTEQVLLTGSQHLTGDALRHSLHWAFPQAYYSVFAVTLAAFKARGYTETSHAAVIRKFGSDAQSGRYPAVLAFNASGVTKKTFQHVCCTRLTRTLEFDANNPDLIDGQIAQFLGATRDLDLKEKKLDFPLKTKGGKRKKAFNPADWARVSDAMGPTSLLSLLYRKRIKANYRDIDSFLSEEIDPSAIYRNLLRVVGATNYVHEATLDRLLGDRFLIDTMAKMPRDSCIRPLARLPHVEAIRS